MRAFCAYIGGCAATLALVWAVFAVGTASATAATMKLDCDGEVTGVQSDCTWPVSPTAGSRFETAIYATEPPAQGYLGFDASVSWTNVNLNYVTHELPWKDCAFPASAGPQPVNNDASREYVAVGCAAGVGAGASHETGQIFKLDLRCVTDGTTTVRLDEGSGNTDYLIDVSTSVLPSTNDATVHCGNVIIDPKTGKPDVTGPEVKLSARRNQHVLGQRGVIVNARCNERCTLALSGSISVPGASKVHKLGRGTTVLGANADGKLKLGASKRTLNALRRAFKKRKRLVARVSGTASDLVANDARTPSVKIGLRR